jgi:lysophospholipase L1-like esterase
VITGYLRTLLLALFFLLAPTLALAGLPAVVATVRYMSLGDSLAAGYKAQPATKGYAYRLYLDRVFGNIQETVFANAAVPGATSADVRKYQLPQVSLFAPTVVTMSVGGNDLLTLLGSAPPTRDQVTEALEQFGDNLAKILMGLCSQLPANGAIYLHNLYTVPKIAGANEVVPYFNATMAQVVDDVQQDCAASIAVADVYGAFLNRKNLLLIERYLKKGIVTDEVHPTDLGYRVMEDAFRAVIVP